MTAAAATARRIKAIPLRNNMPARKSDDIEFVLRALRGLKNEKGDVIGIGRISEVCRALGLPVDRLGGGRTKEYHRIRAALMRAKERGLVKCEDLEWEAT